MTGAKKFNHSLVAIYVFVRKRHNEDPQEREARIVIYCIV
jgi:hypothetical protein